MYEDKDIRFMRRCLDLASRAEGHTYPNPLVGSVIVHNDIIIGEGYHLQAGYPHAEVVAVNSVTKKELLKESILYVNLEPCCHHGRTPPCTELILAQGIKKVVVGTTDTSEKVNGRGISILRDAGCEVISGVLEEQCRWLNRRFFTFVEQKRPYIILKWAQSADGYIDTDRERNRGQKPAWITGNPERVLVHRWRSSEQAILAGAETIRSDNPKLNIRYWKGEDPLRIIISGSGNISTESDVFKINGTNVVFTNNMNTVLPNTKIVKLKGRDNTLSQITKYLYNAEVQSVIIEGGASVLSQFISAEMWDEARIFTGKQNFRGGIKAPSVSGITYSSSAFSASYLEMIQNRRGITTQGLDNIN